MVVESSGGRLILAPMPHNLDEGRHAVPALAAATCIRDAATTHDTAMPASSPAETLLIEGADALAFAHAQFSSDVRALAVGTWQFSAWLDAQGRVRALFHLARLEDQRLLLLLRGGSAATLGDALGRFVLRSRVRLQVSPWRTLAAGDALPLHALQALPHGVALGAGTHSLRITADGEGDDRWRAPQLQAGWPWLPADAAGTLLPPSLSLHRLHAVSTGKGCYPGQEIVARLHFRGGNKRHLCSVEASREVRPGESLCRHGAEVGRMLDGAATIDGRTLALAVLHADVATPGAVLPLDDMLTLSLLHRWGD